MIRREHIRRGAVVVDIGINPVRDPALSGDSMRLVGDVDLDAALERARCITAVPDGVGPVTAAQLMIQVVRSASAQHRGLG